MNYYALSEQSFKQLHATRDSLKNSPLSQVIQALVELRTSQINGCQYCIDLHYKEALNANIPQDKVDNLIQWRQCPLFNEAECAALQWAEEVTTLDDYAADTKQKLAQHFSAREIADLTLCISLMNTLNRVAITLRSF
jgi:AhpD family alkylhydroperoxidase